MDTNWLDGVTASAFATGDNVFFTDAGLAGGSTVTVDAGGVSPGTVNVSNTTGTYTLTGGPITASGVLIKTGAGTLELDTTYSAPVTVSAGVLRTLQNELLSNIASVTVGEGATLDLNNNTETVGGLDLTGATVTTGTGSLVMNGNAAIGASAMDTTISGALNIGSVPRNFNTVPGSTLVVDATVSGTAGGRFAIFGGGVVELNADNRTTLTTNVQLNTGATLRLGHKGALGSAQFFANGGTVHSSASFLGGDAVANPVSLGGNVTFSGSDTEWTGAWTFFTAAAKTITVQNNMIISGNITGSGTGADLTVNVDTAGSLVLSGGASAFTKLTLTGDGITYIEGVIANPVINNGAGLLFGGGTVGALVINAGTLAAGSSTDTYANFNVGSLGMSSTATLSLELDGLALAVRDQITTSSTVTFDNTVLEISLGFTPSFGDSFLIVDNGSGSPVSGTFLGLSEGASFFVGLQEMEITYAGGDGNDVVLTAVPEPGSALLLLGGIGLLGIRRRRA